MKIQQMKMALNEFRLLLSSLGCVDEGKEIQKFSEIFDGSENQTVAAFAKKLSQGRVTLGREQSK